MNLESLFTIKKQQVKMMRDRGYDISIEEPIFSYNLKQFIDVYNALAQQRNQTIVELLSQTYSRGNEKCLVIYFEVPAESKQLGLAQVSNYLVILQREKYDQGIIITNKPPSKDVEKSLRDSLVPIQVFEYKELRLDPLTQCLAPIYQVLTPTEKNSFLSSNAISGRQLPLLLSRDPVAKYLGLKPGTVVRIIKENLITETTVERAIEYRIVV